MQLDMRFQFPKFSGQMNGETVDSWLRRLFTYFKTCLAMEEDIKIHIGSLQLEGIAQAWWDTQLENFFEIDESTDTCITSWDNFCQALHNLFYPPGYLYNLLAKWLQL
jgi:hypothetical protein